VYTALKRQGEWREGYSAAGSNVGDGPVAYEMVRWYIKLEMMPWQSPLWCSRDGPVGYGAEAYEMVHWYIFIYHCSFIYHCTISVIYHCTISEMVQWQSPL